jgi:predicted transcriptional regulator
MERSKKRTGLEIKKSILSALSDNKIHSFGDLERKVNSDWQTIRRHCEELEYFNIVEIKGEGVLINEKDKRYI